MFTTSKKTRTLLGASVLLLATVVTIAITSSASPVSKTNAFADPLYYIYNSGPQNVTGSYGTPSINKPTTNCPNAVSLCWFRVDDRVAPFGTIDGADFTATFNALNTDGNSVIDNNDATAEDHELLELKN